MEDVLSAVRPTLLLLSLQEVVQLPLDFVKQLCLKIQSERPGKGV